VEHSRRPDRRAREGQQACSPCWKIVWTDRLTDGALFLRGFGARRRGSDSTAQGSAEGQQRRPARGGQRGATDDGGRAHRNRCVGGDAYHAAPARAGGERLFTPATARRSRGGRKSRPAGRIAVAAKGRQTCEALQQATEASCEHSCVGTALVCLSGLPPYPPIPPPLHPLPASPA
jgi:hypothetical protein